MITIEDMKLPPVGTQELREAYQTIQRHCRECHDGDSCDNCRLQGLCRVNLQPRFWPDYDMLQYGGKENG